MTETTGLEPERWVDRHGDVLYRFALARLRQPDLAAELVQDTFLHALRSRAGFSGRSSERTWLTAILKHKILDHYRRDGRMATADDEALEAASFDRRFDDTGHWVSPPSDWPGDPSGDLERREFWEVVRSCLDRMPAHLAQTFLLRTLDEVDSPEVCQALKITPTNLWARLHRARTMLRECLERCWFAPGTSP